MGLVSSTWQCLPDFQYASYQPASMRCKSSAAWSVAEAFAHAEIADV